MKIYMMKNLKYILFVAVAVLLLNACSPAGGERTGSEYMPDMAHSIAYEANVYGYYHHNTWDSAGTVKRRELSMPFLPVEGSVPRGYAGIHFAGSAADQERVMDYLHGANALNAVSVPVNGNVPYYYGNTEEERARATAELIDNPFPITESGLKRGEELYNIFCGICHGVKGDGVGYLVSDENRNAKYPAAPANFLLDDFVASSNGRYYHSIMWGRNVMGSYKDKLSYEERWQVIHWIRALQAKDKKLEYSQMTNTLNPEFGIPAGNDAALAQRSADAEPQPADGGAQEETHEEQD